MARIVAVHGIAQQRSGRQQLLRDWTPALGDGIERALGRRVGPPDLDIAYYGDVFLRRGIVSAAKGNGAPAGVLDGLSDEEIVELAGEIAEPIPDSVLAAAADDVSKGYTRVPLPMQTVLRALDRMFGMAAGVLYVGVLRQVRRYLVDPDVKAEVDGRVDDSVGDDCRLLIGHSLGSVVAYEYVRRHPGKVAALLVLGSPLGLRMVRDRIDVGPLDVPEWTAVRDPHDPVACAGDLVRWWPQVVDRNDVDNGGDAHSVEYYLGKDVVGRAVVAAVPTPLG